MINSVIPTLKENKKFVTHFNKMMKNKEFTYMSNFYGVVGYPQIKVTDNEVVIKMCVTKGYVKYYNRTDFNDVKKGDLVYRKITSRIKSGLGYHIYSKYIKHLGLKYHETRVSVSWV